MKMLVIIILLILSMPACIFTDSKVADSPQPPSELEALPLTASVGEYWVIWEYPGLPPRDSDSDIDGWMGQRIGVTSAGHIQVLRYAWSSTDQEFYVLIRQGEAKGWIPFEALTFDD